MPPKMIAGDLVWKAGATWDTGPPLNTGSQTVIDTINLWPGGQLYTGDIVMLGLNITNPDPTAVNVSATNLAQTAYVIGVVGGITNMPGAGGSIPFTLANVRVDLATYSAASTTITDPSAQAQDVGKGILGPNIPSGAFIVSVVAGTQFTINVPTTGAGPGVFIQVGSRQSSVGPGWLAGAFPAGDPMPVVIGGVAYVNVGANTVAAGGDLATSATPRVASTPGTPTAGTNIGVALEANTAGIPNGDNSGTLIRAWIGKF